MDKRLPCPCHSKKGYKTCCYPYHEGKAPPTPLALMRSRYSAYALGLTAYIQKTTHPESPHYQEDKETWRKEVEAFSCDTRFLGLEIIEATGDTVTFRAELRQGDQDTSFVEKSVFIKKRGSWYYFEAKRGGRDEH